MIKIVREDKTTAFGDIEVGTLFFAVYCALDDKPDYDTIWLKTTPVTEVADETYEELNAAVVVGDETGTIHRFEDDEKVIPIYNAEIVIEK